MSPLDAALAKYADGTLEVHPSDKIFDLKSSLAQDDKAAKISQASADKQQYLASKPKKINTWEEAYLGRMDDADSGTMQGITGEELRWRLGSPDVEKRGVDAAETYHGPGGFKKDLSYQKSTYAYKYQVPIESVTDQMIYEEGALKQKEAEGPGGFFRRGQNTFDPAVDTGVTEDDFPPIVAYDRTGKLSNDASKRPITEMANPFTEELYEPTLNNPEDNAYWSAPWNEGARAEQQAIQKKALQEQIYREDPINNFLNKGLYGFSTGISLGVGGVNALLRGAEFLTDDPEFQENLQTGRGFLNKVNEEVGKWVDRTNVQGAIANIDPELEAATKSFQDARVAIEKGDYAGATKNVLGLLANAGGAIGKFVKDDPDAVADIIFESLPQMWAAAKNYIGGTVLITARYFNENVEAFKKEHDGREPDKIEYAKIFAASALSAASEAASANYLLKPFIGKMKAAKEVSKKAVIGSQASAKKTAQGFKDAAKQGKAALAKEALLGTGRMAVGAVGLTAKGAAKALKSAPIKRGVTGIVTEGGQEAFQTASEEYAKYLEFGKIDPKTTITGGVMGSAAGGAMGAAGGVAVMAQNAAGENVDKAFKSIKTARAKATAQGQKFTTDAASKRDPERAFGVEDARFKAAKSQEEAFKIIGELGRHRDNFETKLNQYEKANSAKIDVANSVEQNHFFDMEDDLARMDTSIEQKAAAAKYKLNPEEAGSLDMAYANLADPDTEYKSEDINRVIANIIYGSENFEGSKEAIEKIRENSGLPDDIRAFLDSALDASKALHLYEANQIKKPRENEKTPGNRRAVRNESQGEGKGGARYYARHLSNAVARHKKENFDNIQGRLAKFTDIQYDKAGAYREAIAAATDINEQIKALKKEGASAEDLKDLSAQGNDIPIFWGTKQNEEKPFTIHAQNRAGDDTDLYELKGPLFTAEDIEAEADVLKKISNLFSNIPDSIFAEEETDYTYAKRTDGKTDKEAMAGRRTRTSTNEDEQTGEDEEVTEDEEEEIEDEPPWEEPADEDTVTGNRRERKNVDDDITTEGLGSEAAPETTELGSEEDNEVIYRRETPYYDELPFFDHKQESMTYAGVGNRKGISKLGKSNMIALGKKLAKAGYRLNTGGAEGSDSFFQEGAEAAGGGVNIFTTNHANKRTRKIAKEIHPKGKELSGNTLDLMARNTNQVFGKDLKVPVDFVLVFTRTNQHGVPPQHFDEILYDPEDKENHTGGTAQAIALADRKGIPVINLNQEMDIWYPRLLKAMRGEIKGGISRPGAEGPRAAPKRTVVEQKEITVEDLQANTGTAYLFGDNDAEEGKDGQAIIRDEKNAYGIPTKVYPGKKDWDYYSDQEYDENIRKIEEAFQRIPEDMDIVMPSAGLGTGRAHLKDKAPRTLAYINARLDAIYDEANPDELIDIDIWWGGKNGPMHPLSNLAPRQFTFKGEKYRSVEHAYQTLKSGTFNKSIYDEYAKADSVAGMKRSKGPTDTNTSDALMEAILRASFEQDATAMLLLKGTTSSGLTHKNDTGHWRDAFPAILEKIRNGSTENNEQNGQSEEAAAFVAEHPEMDYMATTVSIFQDMLFTDPVANTDKAKLSQDIKNLLEKIPKGELVNPEVNGVTVRNTINDMLFDFYEKYGWPTTQQVNVNTAHGTSRGVGENKRKFYELFTGKKDPVSVLATMPDFMEISWFNDDSLDKLNKKQGITEDDTDGTLLEAYEVIWDLYEEIEKNLDRVLHKNPSTNKYVSLKSSHALFIDKNGNLNPNVISALVISGMDYIAKESNKTMERDDRGMNKFLGLDRNKYLGYYDKDIITALRQAGPLRRQVKKDLGRVAINQLNLKALPQTDVTDMAHLADSLGTLALDAMVEAGLLEHTDISFTDLASLDKAKKGPISIKFNKSKTTARFARAATQRGRKGQPLKTKEGKIFPIEKVRDLMEATTKHKKVYEKLFGITLDDTIPSDEPITEVDTRYKNTESTMSEYTEKVVEHLQKVPWHNKKDLRNQLNRFPDIKVIEDKDGNARMNGTDYRAKIFGWIDPASKHITEQAGIETTNASLIRHWENYNNYLNGRTDAEAAMYLKYRGAVNNRLHVENLVANYQSSKTIRWLMVAATWIKNINVSNYKENKSLALRNHKIAIVEAFGISAKNHTHDELIDEFHKGFIDKNGVLKKQYRAVVKILNTGGDKEFTDTQARKIYDAVFEGGEGTHTFAGLQALADLAKGIQDGNKSLEISLAREIDGTTNGVISALLQLVGTNTKEITQKGGMTYRKDGLRDFAEWIQKPGNKDNYQEIAARIYDIRAEFVQRNARKKRSSNLDERKEYNEYYVEEQEATFATLGEMGEIVKDSLVEIASGWRELHKDPLMVLVYGASMNKIIENFTDLALKRFYADLVENYDNKPELLRIFTNLQNMGLPMFWGKKDKKGQINELDLNEHVDLIYNNLEEAREWEFYAYNKKTGIPELSQFRKKIETYYTEPLKEAMEEYLGDFMDMQKGINNSADIMNRIFMGMWEQKKAEIRKKYNRSFSEEERLAFDLDMQSKGLMPGAASPTTDMESASRHASYIQATKTDTKPVSNVSNREIQIQYKEGTTIDILDVVTGKTHTNKSLYTDAITRDYTYDIGVRFFTLLNHAIDSSVIQGALGTENVQDIFDAFLSGSFESTDISKLMDQSFLEVQGNYSMSEAVAEALPAFIKAYKKLNKENQEKVVHGFKNAEMKLYPMLEYKFDFGGTVSEIHLLDPALGLGESVAEDPKKALSEFPKALKKELLPLLKQWHENHVENFNEILDGQQFPDKGLEGSAKGPAATGQTKKENGKDWKSLGSEDFDSNRNFEPKNKGQQLNATAARETFHKIKNIGNIHDSLEHQAYLENTLNNSILPVMATLDAFTLHLGTTKTGERHVGSIKGQDIYLGANEGIQNTNSNPSPQEIYIHEMFHAVMRWGIEHTPKMGNEIRKMFELAEADPNIDYKAFLRKDADPNDAGEIKEAQRKYDYIFNTGGPGYLHEFASFGLSNEAFMNALGDLDITSQRSIFEGTIPQRLLAAAEYIAKAIKTMVHGTQPKNARDALIKLSQNINGINNQTINKFDEYWGKSWGAINSVAAAGLRDYMLKPYIKSVVKLQQGREKRRVEGKGANRLVDRYLITPYIIPKEIIYDNFLGSLSEVAWDMGLTMDNVAHHFMTEVRGPTIISKKYHKFLREGKHAIDSAVQHKSGSIANVITEAYGRELSDKEWMNLASVALKGDLSALVGVYSMHHIRNMLASIGAVQTEIAKLKTNIRNIAPINANLYINQAKSLGGFMAIGKDGVGMTMHNAHTIANMTHLERFGYVPENSDTSVVEEYIDRLATLEAIRATPKDAKKDVVNIIDEEFTRNVETNGFELLLKMHASFKEDSLKLLFNGNKTLMMKGWTSELYDEYKSFQIGTKAQQAEFAEQGFVLQEEVKSDRLYANTPKQYMYVSKDGLLNRRVTGNMGLTNKIGKGHDLLSLAYQEIKATPGNKSRNPNKIAAKNHADYENSIVTNIALQFAGELDMDYKNNWLVPLLKGSGNIHTYRYTMSERTKIQALGKRDLANAVMGRMHGSLIAKPATTKQNTSVLQYAFTDWKKNYADDPRQFIHITGDMPNGLTKAQKKKHKKKNDLFHLLPTDTFREMERIWGADVREGFYIREDLMYLIGGFRKAAFTDWLDEHTGEIMPHQLKHIMRLSGILWEAVVATGKRNIILFLPQIVTDNTYSNTIFLMMRGVPPAYAVKKETEAVAALLSYYDDMKKIGRLEALISADPKHSNTQNRKLRLERLLKNQKRNPAHKLIDEGLFQALSEDLASSSTEDYEGRIKKAVANAFPVMNDIVEGVEGKIPKAWQNLYDFAVFDPKDPLAQAITRATQFSDFAARYALYSWRTEQQKDKIPPGMTEAQWAELAVEEAQDVFVNYDDPSSPEMQWLNDMGVIMFTKYMFRMMRVVLRTFKENPGKVVGMKLLEDSLIGGADVYDNSLLLTKNITDNMFGPWDHLMNAMTPNSFRFANGIFDIMPGAGE